MVSERRDPVPLLLGTGLRGFSKVRVKNVLEIEPCNSQRPVYGSLLIVVLLDVEAYKTNPKPIQEQACSPVQNPEAILLSSEGIAPILYDCDPC